VSESFTIVNGDTEPYDFTASIGAGWTVSPTSGTVPLNGATLITVTPPAEGSVTPGTANDVQVTIATDIPGDTAHVYAVDGTATGAEVAFAETKIALSAESTVNTTTAAVTNSGNAEAIMGALVVAATTNSDYPSTAALQINSEPVGVWSGIIDVGTTTLTYTYTAQVAPCGTVFLYTITLPSTTTDGVCSSTTQTLQISDRSRC